MREKIAVLPWTAKLLSKFADGKSEIHLGLLCCMEDKHRIHLPLVSSHQSANIDKLVEFNVPLIFFNCHDIRTKVLRYIFGNILNVILLTLLYHSGLFYTSRCTASLKEVFNLFFLWLVMNHQELHYLKVCHLASVLVMKMSTM